MSFLDDYEPVEDRLRKFWDDHPEGQIHTKLLDALPGEFIVKAYVWRDQENSEERTVGDVTIGARRADATGLAHEVVGQGNVNKTSALENCETSAIGRALANLGYAPKGKRPSREEMEKATREDPQVDGSEWLAGAVQMFTEWTEDQRRETAAQVAHEVGAKKPITIEEAKQVFEKMKGIYLETTDAKEEGAPF